MGIEYTPARKRANQAYALRKKQLYTDYKAERGCLHCGEKDPVVLDAHHRDKATKHKLLTRTGKVITALGIADLVEELAKCDILCANCHRREEARLRNGTEAN